VIPDHADIRFGRTRFVFGWGRSPELVSLASDLGTHVLFVTSETASGQANVINDLRSQLESRGCSTVHFAGVQPDPDVTTLERVLPEARKCDVIVGIGGGSVLDAGKGLAVAAMSDLSPSAWLHRGTVGDDSPRKPLVLVPTTAGTGSELSFGAILSDRSRQFKGGLRGPRLAPDVALVDPALTVTAPPKLTAETGFDIVTHAFESFVSRKATSQSRMLSVQAVHLVRQNLHRAVTDPNDRSARTCLSYAASAMGLNLASVGTCLPHRLQYPIGGVLPETSHPQGLSWIYPTWIRHVYPHVADDVSDLMGILGLSRPTDAQDASNAIRDWLENLGLATRPSCQLDPAMLAGRVTGNLASDPIPEPESVLETLYAELFA
jgi:alcohol dehydrogenase class IV